MVKKQIIHKSMRGKIVDMELLRKKNELVPAIGNAKVNARGDELGAGGKIIRKREDIVKDHYQKTARDEQGRYIKKENFNTINKTDLTEDETILLQDDDWEEDKEGNYVPKKTTRKK